MYWPSSNNGQSDSNAINGYGASYSLNSTCDASVRRCNSGPTTMHALMQPLPAAPHPSAVCEPSSNVLIKSPMAFPLYQDHHPLERGCYALSHTAGTPDSQPPYGGAAGDYSACAFATDFTWSVVSMVPPGNYRDSSLDSCDTASSMIMDLSKTPSKRRPGGRRPKEDLTQLNPEEEEKRRLRRLRNKEAAARCRRRRVEHMCRLEGEVEELLMEKERLQEEISALQQEKINIETILENHLPYCNFPCGESSSEDDGRVARVE